MAGLALLAVGSAQAVTVLSEGFNDLSTLVGWAQVNNSTAPVGTAWFQGNSGVFPAQAGAVDSYAAANFLGTTVANGAVSNWLITPTLTLDASSIVSFFAAVGGASFTDKVEVRFSPNGASTNVGATPTSVGDFTLLLGTYTSSTAGWVSQSYGLASLAAPTSGRIAFRYVVNDVSADGSYLGIDSLTVTAVPEPAALALIGLGLAGLLLRRRLVS